MLRNGWSKVENDYENLSSKSLVVPEVGNGIQTFLRKLHLDQRQWCHCKRICWNCRSCNIEKSL